MGERLLVKQTKDKPKSRRSEDRYEGSEKKIENGGEDGVGTDEA